MAVSRKLELSQEQTARLLGVSFASVKRGERGQSVPTGPIQDLYASMPL